MKHKELLSGRKLHIDGSSINFGFVMAACSFTKQNPVASNNWKRFTLTYEIALFCIFHRHFAENGGQLGGLPTIMLLILAVFVFEN